jgi:hypothetical protein
MPPDPKFLTGAIPTPRYKLAAARPHILRGATPAQVIIVPPFLEMWLNDQYGDCVTAEEAFAKAFYSVMMGQPETKITDDTVKKFCEKYDFLNGANLTDVMDKMISEGFQQDGGYKDGPYSSVDYSNEAALQNAISIGPVKIGMDASALPSGAGNANGWHAFGGRPGEFSNEDHCTCLCGYGPTEALFKALGVPVPAGAPAAGYYHYTWSTIGVVDHAWIMSTCGEAWVRNPTTPGVIPVPPPVPPTPPTPPTPPAPVSTLQEVIDFIFEMAEAASPFGGNILRMVQKWVDAYFAAHPAEAHKLVECHFEKENDGEVKELGAKAGSIQPIVDAFFAELIGWEGNNTIAVILTHIAQSVIDAYIVSQGW